MAQWVVLINTRAHTHTRTLRLVVVTVQYQFSDRFSCVLCARVCVACVWWTALVQTHTHIHIYTYVRTHAHIHTHTQTRRHRLLVITTTTIIIIIIIITSSSSSSGVPRANQPLLASVGDGHDEGAIRLEVREEGGEFTDRRPAPSACEPQIKIVYGHDLACGGPCSLMIWMQARLAKLTHSLRDSSFATGRNAGLWKYTHMHTHMHTHAHRDAHTQTHTHTQQRANNRKLDNEIDSQLSLFAPVVNYRGLGVPRTAQFVSPRVSMEDCT